ncbi:MAG: sulfite exporter TauE/SafE family protein [Candidatus Buchananbacteria bacterium]
MSVKKIIIGLLVLIALSLIGGWFILVGKFPALIFPSSNSWSYWLIFMTGLTTGGLTCLAIQGGLLISSISAQEQVNKQVNNLAGPRRKLVATTAFVLAKLIAYTVVGFLLGSLGSVLQLNGTVRASLQILIGVYMLAVALNLLSVHPIFRYVVIPPPRFLYRYLKNYSQQGAWFTPGLLGALTIFLPCATTQAMEVLALGSGSAVRGAAIMLWFILGTIPMFVILGWLITRLGEKKQKPFFKLAGAILIVLGLMTVNSGLILIGSPVTWQSVTQVFGKAIISNNTEIQGGKQVVTINIDNSGYNPGQVVVKKGVPVQLILKTKETYSCARSVVFSAFSKRAILLPNDEQVVEFTPDKVGDFSFSCSMGMYQGIIRVVD